MEKRELVSLTLDKMLEKFDLSPESFELGGSFMSSPPADMHILWKPKIEIENDTQLTVDDPNNSSAIIVKICTTTNEISCYLFNKSLENFNSYSISQADSTITVKPTFMRLNSCYRKFIKLHKKIIQRDINNENRKYLKRLMTIFPDTFDNIIIRADSDNI